MELGLEEFINGLRKWSDSVPTAKKPLMAVLNSDSFRKEAEKQAKDSQRRAFMLKSRETPRSFSAAA